MIYSYELEILRHLHRCIPAIKLMTYSSDEDLLEGLDKIKEFPACYYSRTNYNVEWNKPIVQYPEWEYNPDDPLGNTYPNTITFYPYEVEYKGTILVENQRNAFQMVAQLKQYLNKNPYIWIPIPGLSEQDKYLYRVSIFLLNLTVDDVRLPNDKNGACRAVHFSWKSQMFINDAYLQQAEGLVEQVNVTVKDGDDTLELKPFVKCDLHVN